jgi:tRNA pseudouridine38-40 synthase
VQAALESALGTLLREDPPPRLTVAGRTDAGVHALGQVASYEHEAVDPRALNALLPDDVAVLDCRPAQDGFDARHWATSRAYAYRVLNRRPRSVFDAGRALHWVRPLNRGALSACAEALAGTHDFTAFTPTDTYHVRFERDISFAAWRGLDPERLEFRIEADAFMRGMVRSLVGTMLEVGEGRRTVESFVALLGGAARSEAGPTAAAHGLYLAGVGYGGRRVLQSDHNLTRKPPRQARADGS